MSNRCLQHRTHQPDHYPPVKVEQPSLPPPPELPNSNTIGKSSKANAKKRKKGDLEPPAPIIRPKPEDMPPKPPFTYAQLIYRAIKDIGGKATLQEICTWIMSTHEYYRYADGAWMSSVRHNLSSGRAFLKMERCGGDRGKGFFWSVDEKYAQALEEQESKAQAAAQAAASGIKDIATTKPRKKDKVALLEPPLKRSIKGDLKGTPLPPPLTSTPLAFKTSIPSGVQQAAAAPQAVNSAATGIFPYPSAQQATMGEASSSQQRTQQHQYATSSSVGSVNPYTPLTQWNLHPSANGATAQQLSSQAHVASPPLLPHVHSTASTSASTPTPLPQPATPKPPTQAPPAASSTAAPQQAPPTQGAVPDVVIPIVLGVIPPTHPDYTPGAPNNSAKEGYMVLHERTLILDPNVFSGLTKERLGEIERMGARAALAVLTQHMVKALKERRARERGKDRERKGKKSKKGLAGQGGNAGTAGASSSRPTQAQSASATPTPGPAQPVTAATSAPAPPMQSLQSPLAVIVQTSAPPPPPAIAHDVVTDPGSPLIVVDDSEDEGPAMKRRKLDGTEGAPAPLVMAT